MRIGVLIILASAASASSRVLRVCAAGGDYSTAHEAVDAALRLRAGGYSGQLIIELCEGSHAHSTTLVVGREHTSDVADTIIRGAGAGAFLEGGLVVTGWVPSNRSTPTLPLLEADLPAGAESRQLWVNGARATRAHARPEACSGGPVVPSLNCTKPFWGNITETGYNQVVDVSNASATPLSQWLAGTELVYGRGASGATWTEPRCTVASVVPAGDGTTVNIAVEPTCWAQARGKGTQSVTIPSDVENALPLLDERGEWWADFSRRRIYYAPRPGEAAGTLEAVLGTVPAGGSGEALSVTDGARRVRLENLGARYLTWLEPSQPGGFVDLQSGYFRHGPSDNRRPSPQPRSSRLVR